MKKHHLPHIGQRILRSSAGVFMCYIIYMLRGRSGIPFYSMLAVLWCIQPYTEKTHKMAEQRTTGTLIGALFGLCAILLEIYVFDIYDKFLGFFLNALFIIPVIYTTVLMHKQNASYFSCVVYLSITVIHIADEAPFIFVFNRVLDTFIGIAVGLAVNSVHFPRKKVRDCLFVGELDDMLAPVSEDLSAYSKVEINRMTEDGMNFTVATMRTPASLIRPLDGVALKLPVIVMDGAALYDLKENTYLKTCTIPHDKCRELTELIRSCGMNCFINSVCDDTLIIFYDKLENEAETDIFRTLKRSPYRNYIHREPSADDRTLYIMLIDKSEKVNGFYKKLEEMKYTENFKVLCYPSDDYKGFSYIKIYNKDSSRSNMLKELMKIQNTEKIVLIGRRKEDDIIIDSTDLNDIIRTLKNTYEPTIFSRQNKRKEKIL